LNQHDGIKPKWAGEPFRLRPSGNGEVCDSGDERSLKLRKLLPEKLRNGVLERVERFERATGLRPQRYTSGGRKQVGLLLFLGESSGCRARNL